MKRGLTYMEAIDYVGVKRRTFDQRWRPHLVAMPQGACLIFDREDLDRLFAQFKSEVSSPHDGVQTRAPAQNGHRNGWPIVQKGVQAWAEHPRGSTPEKTEPGKLTSGRTAADFASVASSILKKQSAG